MLPALWRLVRRSPRIAVATVLGAALLALLWLSGRPAPSVVATGGGAGSAGTATPLSGVYAPIRQQQPLPVLVHFTEAPIGPNATRVPLRGCVAVARALGDYTTKRAGLQLDTLSCVLPSGRAVSSPVTGW